MVTDMIIISHAKEKFMQLIPNIGLAKFKLHPTKKAQENPITCVLAHNVEAFYTVTPERMKELLIAEKMLERIKQDNESQSQLLDMPF